MPALFRLALAFSFFSLALGACATASKTTPSSNPKPQPAPVIKAPVRFTIPATTLNGQVLNAANQAPIEGVKILTFPATVVVTTNSAGLFSLKSTTFRADVEYTLSITWRSTETTLQVAPIRLGEERTLDPIYLEETPQTPYIEDIATPSSLDEGPEYPTLEAPAKHDNPPER